MSTIMDYIYWRSDLDFESSSFNILDNLVFAEATYIDYEGVVPSYPTKEKIKYKDAIDAVFIRHEKDKMVLGLIVPQVIVEMVDRAHNSVRFGSIYCSNYINIIDMDTKTQFSAICFHISDDLIYIAYRGTDDTLIGWQENVDMLYSNPVGAQVMAVDYIEKIAELFPKARFYMGGHSKGGNLANYAAIYASEDVKDRIIHCYSNDGQGMSKKAIDKAKFDTVKKKITRVIPESDVVGMIFDPFAGHTVICKSIAKGIYQHDGFSWEIEPTGFSEIPDVSPKAKKMDKVITRVLINIPEEDKKILGKNLYDFIMASQLNTLLDCKKESIRLLKHLNKFSGKSRQIFLQLFSEFLFF